GGRLADTESACGLGHPALDEQAVQRHEQIEIESAKTSDLVCRPMRHRHGSSRSGKERSDMGRAPGRQLKAATGRPKDDSQKSKSSMLSASKTNGSPSSTTPS